MEGATLQCEKHSELFHDFSAGGVALQNLPEPAPESAL